MPYITIHLDMETALPDRKPLGWNDDLSPNIISIESNNLPLVLQICLDGSQCYI